MVLAKTRKRRNGHDDEPPLLKFTRNAIDGRHHHQQQYHQHHEICAFRDQLLKQLTKDFYWKNWQDIFQDIALIIDGYDGSIEKLVKFSSGADTGDFKYEKMSML